MNIVICHAGVSGYLSACWRELASRPGVKLHIYAPKLKDYYSDDMLNGLPIKVIPFEGMDRPSHEFNREIASLKPDVVMLPGWWFNKFTDLAYCPELKGIRKLMVIDSAWEGTWKQLLAPLKLRGFIKRLDGVIVAGERGRQFARYVGFRAEQIFTSAYGCDFKLFNTAFEKRDMPWPKSFVYLGRYEPVKGLCTLIQAYTLYRARIKDPWLLHCYGAGSLTSELKLSAEMQVHEFVQPHQIPDAYARHGVYILPSLREPWGVSLAEAAAAGLPCICSDKVSSGIDIVRHLYDGLVFPSGNVEALARCLVWMHEHYEKLPIMGERATHYAEAYSAEAWADRILWACEK